MVVLHKESKLTAAQLIKSVKDLQEMKLSSAEIADRLHRKGVLLKSSSGLGYWPTDTRIASSVVSDILSSGVDGSEMGLGECVISDISKRRFIKAIPEDQYDILKTFIGKTEEIRLVTESGMTMSLSNDPKDILLNVIKNIISD